MYEAFYQTISFIKKIIHHLKTNIMKALAISKLLSKLTACIICLFLLSCQKSGLLTNGNNPVAGKSSVNIFLTDDQSLVFDHVFLDIRKVEIKVEDSAEAKHESEHEGEIDDNDPRGSGRCHRHLQD